MYLVDVVEMKKKCLESFNLSKKDWKFDHGLQMPRDVKAKRLISKSIGKDVITSSLEPLPEEPEAIAIK